MCKAKTTISLYVICTNYAKVLKCEHLINKLVHQHVLVVCVHLSRLVPKLSKRSDLVP